MKYIKLKSLTWWTSFASLAAGVFIATVPLHGLADLVAVVNNMTMGMSAPVLINAGLFGIGMRAAV